MSSWVRYCVTVYIGLLLSGALARPSWTHYAPAQVPEKQPSQTQPSAPPAPVPASTDQPGKPKPCEIAGRLRASDTLTG